MRNVLCLCMLTLLCAWSAPAVAVTVGSGGYTDDFSTNKYLTDAYSDAGPWAIASGELQVNASNKSTIVYAFTRTNYASAGVVQFQGYDAASGDGSWLYYGMGSTADSMSWNNMTNYFGSPVATGLVRLVLPAGQQTTYFGVSDLWGDPPSSIWMDNLAVSDNGSAFNALASQALNVGNTTWSANMANYYTQNYKLGGGASTNNTGTAVLLGHNNGDSVTYRIGGNGNTITGGTLSFTGYDSSSGDGSWFNINIYDLNGNPVYWSNLTSLGHNGTNDTLNLSSLGVIGLQGFNIEFSCSGGAGNVGLQAFSVNVNATPEPATMVLLGIGSLAMLRKRRVG